MVISILLKGWSRTKTVLSIYPLTVFLTPLPPTRFSTEKIIGCTFEVAKGANKATRNPHFCFYISCFTALLTPSMNKPESSNDFMILIISFISSFEANKVNTFPALTAFTFIFLSNLVITIEAKLLTSPGTLSLAKGRVIFVSVFFPKLPNQKIH